MAASSRCSCPSTSILIRSTPSSSRRTSRAGTSGRSARPRQLAGQLRAGAEERDRGRGRLVGRHEQLDGRDRGSATTAASTTSTEGTRCGRGVPGRSRRRPVRLHRDVARARRGAATLDREPADVGAELQHRRRAGRRRATTAAARAPSPARRTSTAARAPASRRRRTRARVVDQPERRHRAGDPAAVQPAQHRAATGPAPGASARRSASASATGIGPTTARAMRRPRAHREDV